MIALRSRSGLSRALLALAFAAFAVALCLGTSPVRADGISMIRDTETERLIRSYLDPLVVAAGMQPKAVTLYLINDPTINAFVAEGQNVFVHTGTIMELETPNELIGILAHETGHMSGGHLIRTARSMRAIIIPMLVSMAAGVAAIAAGQSDAGQAVLLGSQHIAEREFLRFTRTQESAADQAGLRYLTATHQSGRGMLKVFRRFEEQEILSYRRMDRFAVSHPASRTRMEALQALVNASPYADTPDSPQSTRAYQMVRAKLRGYIQNPQSVIWAYPVTDTSRPARYARAMAYFRMPDMPKALAEIQSLVAEEPNNPYFQEMMGQIYVEMGRIADGVEPYRKAVKLLPDAPQIRVAFAAALFATGDPKLITQAQVELEHALRQDKEDWFAWYVLAEIYERHGQGGKARLATAERFFAMSNYAEALRFAYLAQQQLVKGSTDWQRASDIVMVAQTQQERR
jgi:predicted Zn-dependent protease